MLRSSCDALVEFLQKLNSDQDETSRFILGMEFESIRKASREDTFISTILDSVPRQAISGPGIMSEAGLRTRFGKVHKVCKGVALVPAGGAGPLTYVLSYIPSWLTVRVGLGQPVASQESEPDKLDTYGILNLADERMKKGDLEGAVDCMAYLEGEPMTVAKDWLTNARAYLETKQAVQLIQTYVSANTHYFM